MKYMLIDVTTVPETRFLAIAQSRETPLLGKIFKAAHPDHKLIAPPLEGRGFSKLEKEQLQYLLWNATQIPPPEDYSELCRALLVHAEQMPCDATPLATLEAEVRRLYPDEPATAATPAAPKEPRAPREPGERPKEGSTTGKVWAIADKIAAANEGNTDWKFLRAIIVNMCTAEGINEATAATQYSKWKASKLAAKAA